MRIDVFKREAKKVKQVEEQRQAVAWCTGFRRRQFPARSTPEHTTTAQPPTAVWLPTHLRTPTHPQTQSFAAENVHPAKHADTDRLTHCVTDALGLNNARTERGFSAASTVSAGTAHAAAADARPTGVSMRLMAVVLDSR